MRKLLRRFSVVLSIIIGIFILLIFSSFVNHNIQLSKEDDLLDPPGKMIEVNDHNIHVYAEGNGEETLVFMSGGGTSSPMLDFKSLYILLSDEYNIAVVEKAGYGFSEVTDSKRDINTILSETREALKKSGVEGPYILFPHSMSGIEALYWAQKYPGEVRAIIGLDMAVPEMYKEYQINMITIRLGAFAADVGLTRWIPGLLESDAIKYGTLTNEEKKLYKMIFYRRTATKTMINEVKSIKTNAKMINEQKITNIPMLMFSSNGQGTGWVKEVWRGYQRDFISDIKNGSLIEIDSSHYIHNIDYVQIAKESKEFISNKLK